MKQYVVSPIPGLVMYGGPGDARERLVMAALAVFADENGVAYPRIDLLAELSLQSERNLPTLLKRLEQQGWLSIDKRKASSWSSRGFVRQGNVYRLNLGKLTDRAERAKAKRRGEDVHPPAGVDNGIDERQNGPRRTAESVSTNGKTRVDERQKGGLLNRTIELDELSELKPPKAPPYDPQGGKLGDAWSKQKPEARASAKATAETERSDAPVTQRGSGNGERTSSRWRRGSELNALSADGEEAALAMEVRGVMRACNFSPGALERAIAEQLAQRVESTRCSINDAGQLMVQRWRQILADMPLLYRSMSPMKFFREGLWLTPAAWPYDRQRVAEGQFRAQAGVGMRLN